MSTKKDKFSLKDKNYMRLAINLARTRQGLTGENPSVGCVIVKNDKIISVGQTGYLGRPHAEYNAIKNSVEDIKGSKMYVSLEPCNHHGKTPPCTNIIIRSGISEIIYSLEDIDKKVRGKSYKILSKRNIKVKQGLLKTESKNLYDSYRVNRLEKMPYITAKIAVSKNKLIYSKGSKRITDWNSDKFTHYLRFKNDSILISSKTLNTDNPKLNCRLKGYENFSPKRIILDKKLESNLNSYVVKSSKNNNTIILYNSGNNKKIELLKKKRIILIKTNLNKRKLFDLKIIFKKLFKIGVRNLLIEGGDRITKNLIQNKLVNKFYLFRSPKMISKSKKYQFFSSFDILNKKYKTKFRINNRLGKDNITVYKR